MPEAFIINIERDEVMVRFGSIEDGVAVDGMLIIEPGEDFEGVSFNDLTRNGLGEFQYERSQS